jgi:hypothetical protein
MNFVEAVDKYNRIMRECGCGWSYLSLNEIEQIKDLFDYKKSSFSSLNLDVFNYYIVSIILP